MSQLIISSPYDSRGEGQALEQEKAPAKEPISPQMPQSLEMAMYPREVEDGGEGFLFLPDGKYTTAHLIYLGKIHRSNSRSPLTEAQETAFRVSKLADRRTSSWMIGGCIVYGVSSAVSCGGVGPGCIGSYQWIFSTLATVANTISSGVSYLSTGVFPDRASDLANLKQNHFHEAVGFYTDLGIGLIELGEENPEQALEIAQNLSIPEITSAMQRVLSAHEARIIVKPLKKAKKFLLEGGIPRTPAAIHNCAVNVLLRNRLDKLEKKLSAKVLKDGDDGKKLSLLEEITSEEKSK